MSFWQPGMVAWLLYAAVVLAFLFLFFMFRRNLLAGRAKALDPSAQTLSALIDGLPAADAAPQAAAEAADPVSTDDAPAAVTEPAEAVDRAARGRLSQRVGDWQATTQDVRDGVGGEQNLLRQRIELDQQRRGELEQALAREQARIEQAEQLREMQADLREKNQERQRHMEICSQADQLIQGAMREVSYRFNRKLRGLVSKTLPLFTENRYEQPQIDDDLTVRAFSSEKRDFMELDEISSGTQRQIMLAVRLALSQELVERTVKGSQFLFLDEPFAFFDEKRTRSALTVLPTLSEELNQIWIIGQAFAGDLRFDLHVRCERGRDSITMPG